MAESWYRDGLRFECTRCGACCTGAPGYVWVDDNELAALANFLQMPVHEVQGLYTRQLRQRRSLREKLNNDCIFWDRDQGCTVYEARPQQCRTWPFWPGNVANEKEWQRTCDVCPGSGTGALISAEEISVRVRATRV